jgi:hypothetical protein
LSDICFALRAVEFVTHLGGGLACREVRRAAAIGPACKWSREAVGQGNPVVVLQA